MDTLEQMNHLLVELFNSIMRLEQKSLHENKRLDLSISEVHTIEAIGLTDTKTMSEVASLLGITIGTLTTSINRLVKKRYVMRKKNTGDRRVVNIALTAKGRVVLKSHVNFHQFMIREMTSGLSPLHIDTMLEALHNLNRYLDNDGLNPKVLKERRRIEKNKKRSMEDMS